MTKPADWRGPKDLDWLELSVNDLAIDQDRLKVAQLVHELTFLVLASEEKDTLKRRLLHSAEGEPFALLKTAGGAKHRFLLRAKDD